jgi:putative flippase GtrA
MGFQRWLVFNGVGIIGFAVQICVLAALLHLRLHYLVATAIAVEVTILHNFAWHERWTWKDRPAGAARRWERLWRFHALNGAVSLAGNLILMRALVGGLGIAPVPANLAAVLACALLNYAASDRLVFRVT